MPMPTIAQETPDQADVASLLHQADARAAALYAGEDRSGPTVETLLAQRVRFFVARLEGRAFGCGGFVPGPHGQAELKRLFVEPAARGLGIGRAILQAAEQAARREGIRLMLLETGVKSVEARALYRSCGYHERGPFGVYGADPLSVFMEKALSGALSTPPQITAQLCTGTC